MKKAVASIWYIGWLLLALLALIMQPTVEGGPSDAIIFKAASAFLFVGIAGLPALLSDFRPLKKIPLIGSERNALKAVGLVVVAFVWLLLFTGINGLHSDEYKAALEQQAAQQRAEQDARRAEEEAERKRQAAEEEAEEAKQREEREAAEKAAEEERQQSELQASESDESASESGQADAEEQPAEEAPVENTANIAEVDFVRVLTNDWGFSNEEAHAAYAVLSDVGCGGIKMVDGRMTEGTSLDAMRGMVGSHQFNFTVDNKRVFYVQITGWKEMDYGWHVNWRGKLKYGIVDKKLSFDLYDSDTVDGGYIARYDAANDAVVPWGESL